MPALLKRHMHLLSNGSLSASCRRFAGLVGPQLFSGTSGTALHRRQHIHTHTKKTVKATLKCDLPEGLKKNEAIPSGLGKYVSVFESTNQAAQQDSQAFRGHRSSVYVLHVPFFTCHSPANITRYII